MKTMEARKESVRWLNKLKKIVSLKWKYRLKRIELKKKRMS
jgi:hypothetical protein